MSHGSVCTKGTCHKLPETRVSFWGLLCTHKHCCPLTYLCRLVEVLCMSSGSVVFSHRLEEFMCQESSCRKCREQVDLPASGEVSRVVRECRNEIFGLAVCEPGKIGFTWDVYGLSVGACVRVCVWMCRCRCTCQCMHIYEHMYVCVYNDLMHMLEYMIIQGVCVNVCMRVCMRVSMCIYAICAYPCVHTCLIACCGNQLLHSFHVYGCASAIQLLFPM